MLAQVYHILIWYFYTLKNDHRKGGQDGKESACSAGDPGSIPGSGRSHGGDDNPLGESYGQRILAGYSPWGCKKLDTAEQLSLHFKHSYHLSHRKLLQYY